MQGMKEELALYLQRLEALTLIEIQPISYANDQTLTYFYATPLVKDFVAVQVGIPTDFSHAQAGAYFQFVNQEINHYTYTDLEEAFGHYVMAGEKEAVNEIGNILCGFYYQKQLFSKAYFYGTTSEKMLNEQTHSRNSFAFRAYF